MRFKLTFQKTSERKLLPFNYHYPLSAWIYKTLARADEGYAKWLHDQGYSAGKKHFKLFTFSYLHMPDFRVIREKGFSLESNHLEMTLSFWAEDATEKFIRGVFMDQQLQIGNRELQVEFQITSVEKLPDLIPAATQTFKCLSPILITKPQVGHDGKMTAQYLHPHDPEYAGYFFNHMIRKYATSMQYAGGIDTEEASNDFPFNLEILSEPRKKGMDIKSGTSAMTKIIPYAYIFRLTAPTELTAFCWHAGFGEKNSLGLGCVDLK